MRFQETGRTASLVAIVAAAIPLVCCSRDTETPDATKVPTATQPATACCPTTTTQAAAAWQRPRPPAANQRIEERKRMVDAQMARPRDSRTPVKDQQVLEVMRAVPRHVFVPDNLNRDAYADHALPIGHDQTISQPYIVALMTELLELTPKSKVLEIGTGSGYQAAVLAHLAPNVYTIEIVKPLAERAQQTLREQGYTNVCCRCGDGYLGWPEAAPFDAIILTCAAPEIPQPLWDQLKPGGRMVMPMGPPHWCQLVVHTKTHEGERRTRTVLDVAFVPLVREEKGE